MHFYGVRIARKAMYFTVGHREKKWVTHHVTREGPSVNARPVRTAQRNMPASCPMRQTMRQLLCSVSISSLFFASLVNCQVSKDLLLPYDSPELFP
jgi:hypothetical protein